MKTIACLAGDGVGPELMAAATRALDRVAELHSLQLDDVHLPFGGEAVTRTGHPLPPETRAGYRDADAILVASPDNPALEGVKADLELAWRVARVQLDGGGDLVITGPVGDWANRIALARAFSSTAARRGRVLCVGESADWRAAVEAERARWSGLEVEEASLGAGARPAARAARVARRGRDGVRTSIEAMVDAAAHFAGSHASVAQAWLPDDGAGRVLPRRERAGRRRRVRRRRPERDAAHRVADAGRGAEAAVGLADARAGGRAPPARRDAPVGEDTRSFTDAVIELLPQSRVDLEHFDEVWA